MKQKFKPLYIVMHDGMDGPLPSIDCRNPWKTLKGARFAIAKQGEVKSRIYYIVKYQPEKRIGR